MENERRETDDRGSSLSFLGKNRLLREFEFGLRESIQVLLCCRNTRRYNTTVYEHTEIYDVIRVIIGT